MKRTATAVLLLSLALATSACSGDEPESAADADTTVDATPTAATSATAPGDEAPADDEAASDPEQAAREVLQAYYENDAEVACSRQTEQYTQGQLREAIEAGQLEQGATCAAMVAYASSFYQGFGMDPSAARYEVVSEGDAEAQVQVVYPEMGDETSTLVFVLDGDTWLLDDEF